ncbi:unnamed protein product, partial [Ascophyllum nodosum]
RSEANQAKVTLALLLDAVQMGKKIVRRNRGLFVTTRLQEDACELVKRTAVVG